MWDKGKQRSDEMREAEIGGQSHSKERQWPEARSKEWNTCFLSTFKRSHLNFRFCPSGLSEKISVFLATKFVVICNSSLRKLILIINLQISVRSGLRYTNPNLILCHSPFSLITLQLIGCLCFYNTPQSFHWLFSLPRMLFPRSYCITFPILQAPA